MQGEPKTFMNVDEDAIAALLKIARVGERQEVPFDFDNGAMALSAAVMSKDMCRRSIEILLAIIADESPDLERLLEGLGD